jgi:hypothetical protein
MASNDIIPTKFVLIHVINKDMYTYFQLCAPPVGLRFLKVSVKDARHISGARTAPVLYEYVSLWEKIESVELRPSVGDRFIWKWTPDGSYSASSAYRSFFLGMSSLLGAFTY